MTVVHAVLVSEWGSPRVLTWGEVPTPDPGPGEVRIRVAAAGVNHADLLLIAGKYQVKPDLPFIPGYEVAGTVDAVGGEVPSDLIGTRVAAFSGFGGGFAEFVVVPRVRAVPVPDGLDITEAAVMPATFGTAIHSLFDRGRLMEGETLVVLGASGGVGSAAVQIGAAAGAAVVGAVSSQRKEEWARRMGATHIVRYDEESLRDRIHDLTGGVGADVVFDPVGGAVTGEALRSLAWGGRLLVIGFTSGEIPAIPANLTLLKVVSVVGVFWGAFAIREPAAACRQLVDAMQRMANGTLVPSVTAVYPIREVVTSLEEVSSRRVLGRIALEVGDPSAWVS